MKKARHARKKAHLKKTPPRKRRGKRARLLDAPLDGARLDRAFLDDVYEKYHPGGSFDSYDY